MEHSGSYCCTVKLSQGFIEQGKPAKCHKTVETVEQWTEWKCHKTVNQTFNYLIIMKLCLYCFVLIQS